MPDLTVYRAKPNPAGKDKLGKLSPNSQLNGEWVDIFNPTDKTFSMQGVKLYDHIFSPYMCKDEGHRSFFTFGNFSFPPKKVVRIHSGKSVPVNNLPSVDREGADYHGFTNEGYVLNNACGDKIEIHNGSNIFIDAASYSGMLPEGLILRRQGSVLV